MKTINNKAVRDTVKKYLLGKMCFDNYIGYDGMEKEPETDREKVLACYEIFKKEKGWEIGRIRECTAFKDWLQGLASALTVDFTYYSQGKLLEKWLDVSEKEADRMVENDKFWNICVTVFFEMVQEARKAA